VIEKYGRGIRTTDLLVPNQHLSTTYEHRSLKTRDLYAFGLDPIWTLMANLWRTGRRLDPVWTLVSTLVIHIFAPCQRENTAREASSAWDASMRSRKRALSPRFVGGGEEGGHFGG